MARVNLRDLYPFYKGNCFVDVPNDVLEVIEDCKRREETYQRYLRFYKVSAILDAGNIDKLESMVVDKPLPPYEIYDKKLAAMLLHQSIAKLPDKQAKRIYAHFFLGMSYTEIAKAEGVAVSTICESIEGGLRNLKKNLKRNF